MSFGVLFVDIPQDLYHINTCSTRQTTNLPLVTIKVRMIASNVRYVEALKSL